MTTLEDLYIYYCRRCECKPNSGFSGALRDAYAAAGASRDGIREIDLSSNYVGPKGLEPVLQLCRGLQRVHTVRLCNNMLQHEQVVLLSQYLGRHPAVRSIDLRGNLITDGSVPQLLYLLEQNPNIVDLPLGGNALSAAEIARIADRLTENKAAAASVAAADDDHAALVSDVRAARPKDLPHRAAVDGALTVATSGGHLHYASWRSNPQYLLRVSHAARVAITVSARDTPQDARPLGFAVLRGHAVLRVLDLRPIGDEATIVAESGFDARRACIELSLVPNAGDMDVPLTIVVFTLMPGRAADFTLQAAIVDQAVIDTEGAFLRLDEVQAAYDWRRCSAVGEWAPMAVAAPLQAHSEMSFRCRVAPEVEFGGREDRGNAFVDAITRCAASMAAESARLAAFQTTHAHQIARYTRAVLDPPPPAPTAPAAPARVSKSLLRGVTTLYIVLSKANDSDDNDARSIGLRVVSADQRGRIPARVFPPNDLRANAATDGALLAECPLQRASSVTLTLELLPQDVDVFIQPITADGTDASATSFTLAVFSTCVAELAPYTPNEAPQSGMWRVEERSGAFDATRCGGCPEDNQSWVHNPCIAFVHEPADGTTCADVVTTLVPRCGSRCPPAELAVLLVALKRASDAPLHRQDTEGAVVAASLQHMPTIVARSDYVASEGSTAASFAVSKLPPGRYFLVPLTRKAGCVTDCGYHLRIQSSSSAFKFRGVREAASLEDEHAAMQEQAAAVRGGADPRDAVAVLAARNDVPEVRARLMSEHMKQSFVRVLGEDDGFGEGITLSDVVREQRLDDYREETAVRAPVQRGTGAGRPAERLQFAGCNVKDLLRSGRQFSDRDFPPSASSLWMDTEHEYAGCQPPHEWLRASRVGQLQQEQFIRAVAEGGQVHQQHLHELSKGAMRRGVAFGDFRNVAGSEESQDLPTASEPSSLNATARSPPAEDPSDEAEALDASIVVAGSKSKPAGGGVTSFATSRAYQQYRDRLLPPRYLGCLFEHANLGAQWYLSALACVVTKPATFGARLVVGYSPDGGVAQFRFFIDGAWQNVLIDDYLPVDALGNPTFCTSIASGDFLAPLVEKAYGKVHRCYAALAADRGMIKKRVLAASAPQAGGPTQHGVLKPRPPSTASSEARVWSDQSASLVRPPRASASSGRPGGRAMSSALRPAAILSTDAHATNNAPTAPIVEWDRAPFGAQQPQRLSREKYDGLGVFHGIRYGEPPLVMLQQALVDFTGARVQVFDISSVLPAALGDTPSLGNNATDSAAFMAKGALPPHLAETISGSLFLADQTAAGRQNSVWERIVDCVYCPERLVAGAMMTGASGWEQRKHCGLQYDCLYPIVDAREVDGRRLVKVFNNWGAPSAGPSDTHNTLWWRGKYAWGSLAADEAADGWTPRIKAAVGYDIAHSATAFWMSLTEAMYYFSHLFDASYEGHAQVRHGDYPAGHVGGSLLSTTWINNAQYALTVHGAGAAEDVAVTVGVHQANQRSTMTRARDARYSYARKPLGLAVIRVQDNARRLAHITADEEVVTLFPAAVRDREMRFVIPAEQLAVGSLARYVLMPFASVGGLNDDDVSWDTLVTRDVADEEERPFAVRSATHFHVSASAAVPCSLEKIEDDRLLSVPGEWEGATAGGPPAVGTWRNNPQFLVYPSESCEVTVTLRQSNENCSTANHVGFVVVDGAASHLSRLLHLAGQRYNESTDTAVIPNTVLLDVPHKNDHAVSGTVRLLGMKERRGQPYHIVPSCNVANASGRFVVEVSANKNLRLEPVPTQRDWRSAVVREQFRCLAGTAGGSTRFSTWRNNPQYLLRLLNGERTARVLISVTNPNPNDTEPLGCLLFASDPWGRGRVRKVVRSLAAAQPLRTRLLTDASSGGNGSPRRYPEQQAEKDQDGSDGPGRYVQSRLGPDTRAVGLVSDGAQTATLEEARARLGEDVLADTGAYPHHAEVFYDIALERDQPLVLMPYTASPMVDMDVCVTVLSTTEVSLERVEEQRVCIAEGHWALGVSAGGCRAHNNSWINNPFFELNLCAMQPTQLTVVMIMYPAGPEKPLLKRIGKERFVVPPTIATVAPLSTALTGSDPKTSVRSANAKLHNTHTSVGARSAFGFDIVRSDGQYTPVASSRHTREGEVAVVLSALEPCSETMLPYVIVPHTSDPEQEGYFKLIVYSDKPVDLKAMQKAKRFW